MKHNAADGLFTKSSLFGAGPSAIGFVGDFEKIVAGRAPESPEPFEKRIRKRWVKQTSD